MHPSVRSTEPIITLAITVPDINGAPITHTLTLTPEHDTYTFTCPTGRVGVELLGLHVDPLDAPTPAPEVPAVIGDSLTPPHHHHPDGTVCRRDNCAGPQKAYLYLDLAGVPQVLTNREAAHRAAEFSRSVVAVLPLDGDYRPLDHRVMESLTPPAALPASPVSLALVDDVMTHALAAVPGSHERVLAMIERDAAHQDDDAIAHTRGGAGLTPTPIAEAITGKDTAA